MATPRSQRIGIWVIAIVLTVGTFGSFLALILGNQNNVADQANIQKISKDYSAKVDAQTKELSNKYYGELSKFETVPTAFNAEDVKSLSKDDLKVGNGAEIKADTAYSAYYIGWNPKGKIFDQSIENGALKAPIPGGNLIDGWNEGIIGMKMGGIRQLSIPSDKAYKNVARSEDIPANTPLKFIVMVIPKVNEVTIPTELLQYYQSQQTEVQ